MPLASGLCLPVATAARARAARATEATSEQRGHTQTEDVENLDFCAIWEFIFVRRYVRICSSQVSAIVGFGSVVK